MSIEIKVPNIGNFDAVDVIEVLIKAGDVIDVDQTLLTLESDKASMDVPSSEAGTISKVLVKVGDKIKEGDVIALLDVAAATATPSAPSPAATEITVRVPNIGNFDAVEVIDLLVNVGDSVSIDQNLVTLESDKASMDVPSSQAGVVAQILLKTGDKIKEGDPIVLLKGAGESTAAATAPTNTVMPKATATPPVTEATTMANADCDVVVIGAGPGGYSAAFRAADLGLKVVLVERYATLGGVCLNVGCIPSKSLLHVVKATEEAKHLKDLGITFGAPKVDVAKIRSYKESVVNKLTGGLAAMAKMRKVEVIQGTALFKDDHHLEIALADGTTRTLSFDKAIIAAGSRAAKLPFMPEDPRIIDSTGALEMRDIPKTLLVIGGGIIGLEMATVYATLGTKVTIVEFTEGFVPGADRDLTKVFEKHNAKRFEQVFFKTAVTAAEATKKGIMVTFEGANAPAKPQTYDKVLVAIGRSPNGNLIGAENAGVVVNERGFIAVDKQMRTNIGNIFAIGDLVGQPMLAHKAVHEGHVAAEVCAGHKRYFDVKQIPSVAYADPEMSWTGVTETQAKAEGIPFEKVIFPWSASGKAIANNRDEGFTKLIFDPETRKIIGGAAVGVNAGDLIGEIALAIEMGADSIDIGHTIHPHPTLIESIGMAAELFEGTCTDLPPTKKK